MLDHDPSDVPRWADLLRYALRSSRDVGVVADASSHVEITAWSERAGRLAWKAVDRLGIPDSAVRVRRPIVFFNPFPGDDSRFREQCDAYMKENLVPRSGGSIDLLTSFAPIVGPDARVLVLGSMPGELSLERSEYYAHPRNRFWRLVEDVVGAARADPYEVRVTALRDARIALWDVLKHCSRAGSLDRRIVRRTEVANDIAQLLDEHASITVIALNGGKAAASFRRHIAPALSPAVRERLTVRALPSTSAANARVGYDELLERWEAVLRDR